jgi:hypothetical protein
MDNSLQNAQVVTGKVTDNAHNTTAIHQEAEGVSEEGKHHIHLPSPSLWPLILSVAILVAIAGLLLMPGYPWVTVIAIPFILLGILGWALEDPMAPRKPPVLVYQEKMLHSRFKLGQDVVDKEGQLIGQIRARFPRYILVQSGGLGLRAFYVPQSVTEDAIKDDVVRLTVSEDDLWATGANRVPTDLYDAEPEPDIPQVTGVPLFASAPLSPAQTGHYNYGPNYPGINTDASGSYRRDDVTVRPQSFVAERRKKVYKTPPSAPSQQAAVQN